MSFTMDDVTSFREQYYQISPRIFDSFPRTRPPLDYFFFDERTARVVRIHQRDTYADKDTQEKLYRLCREGMLFVSRADHPIYIEQVAHQLDLVLQDDNLLQGEICDIFMRAFTLKLGDFFEQPLPEQFNLLREDVGVLTEYLWSDRHRIKPLFRRLIPDHNLASHSVNVAVAGTLLFMLHYDGKYTREQLDAMVLGLLVHDLGMTKIPGFVLEREGPLKTQEFEKVRSHPIIGFKLLQRFEDVDEITFFCVLQHHERVNGSGYPQKLHDKKISIYGRIACVADSFAAMVSQRTYADAKDWKMSAAELIQESNRYDKRIASKLGAFLLKM